MKNSKHFFHFRRALNYLLFFVKCVFSRGVATLIVAIVTLRMAFFFLIFVFINYIKYAKVRRSMGIFSHEWNMNLFLEGPYDSFPSLCGIQQC